MSDANHCLCTEIEYLISPETARANGGVDLLKTIYRTQQTLQYCQSAILGVLKDDLQTNLLESEFGKERNLLGFKSLQASVKNLHWSDSAAAKKMNKFLDKALTFPGTDPAVIANTEETLREIALSYGLNIYGPMGARYVNYITDDPKDIMFAQNFCSLYSAKNLATNFILEYHKNLSLSSGWTPPGWRFFNFVEEPPTFTL